MKEIPDRESRRENLSGHGGDGGAHHAHLQRKDEDRVKDDVRYGSRDCRDHGETGAAVRADDRVHRLPEYIEGDAQRDPEEVLLRAGIGFRVDSAAEEREDRLHGQKIQGRQDQTASQAEQDGVSDAAVGVFLSIGPQRNGDEGAGAVADHDRDRQRDHGQREDHRVGCVAVGAEIVGVGDEDLVNDVIQGCHNQGNDAGERILPHQHGQLFVFEKCVGFLFHMSSSGKQNKHGADCCIVSAQCLYRFRL